MVAQNHVWRFQSVHINLFHLIFFAHERKFRQYPNQPSEINGLTDRRFASVVKFFVFIIYRNILHNTHIVAYYSKKSKKFVNKIKNFM